MEFDEDRDYEAHTDVWDNRDKTKPFFSNKYVPGSATGAITKEMLQKFCPIHGKDCPGDDGGFLIDGNHPDDMYSVQKEKK